MKFFWDIQRQIKCSFFGKKLKSPPSPDILNMISYPMLCGKLIAPSGEQGQQLPVWEGKNRDCLIRSAMLALTICSTLKRTRFEYVSKSSPACCHPCLLQHWLLGSGQPYKMSWLQWGCVLYKPVTYIPTALLSVRAWVQVLKAGSLGFATTPQREAVLGAEGALCGTSVLAEGSSSRSPTLNMGK